MNAPKSKYVNKTGINYTKTMLTRYVEESLCQENVQLLGIFEKEVSTSLQHIGNLKITCVNAVNRRYEISILMGEHSYINKHVAAEALLEGGAHML